MNLNVFCVLGCKIVVVVLVVGKRYCKGIKNVIESKVISEEIMHLRYDEGGLPRVFTTLAMMGEE